MKNLRHEWQEHQQMLRDAENTYMNIEKQMQELIAQKKFDEALDVITSFPKEFSQTPWQEKIDRIKSDVEAVKFKHEELGQLKEDSLRNFDSVEKKVGELTARDKYEDAYKLIEQAKAKDLEYMKEIETLTAQLREIRYIGFDIELQKLEDNVTAKKAIYEEEMFQKAAKEACEKIIAEADALAGENKFDEAFAKLGTYPQKYADTEWSQRIASKKEEIEAEKEVYEDRQRHIKEAAAEADGVIAEANGLAEENGYDKALELLKSYPAKYSDTDSQARVTAEVAKIKKLQEEYKKKQTTIGIIIAVVIVVVLVIVIAISMGRKGKGKPGVPVITAPLKPEVPPEEEEPVAEEWKGPEAEGDEGLEAEGGGEEKPEGGGLT